MDLSKVSVNVSGWNESYTYVSSGLFNLTRWALNCPSPKPKSVFSFVAPSPPPDPLTIYGFLFGLSVDVFAVFFTCLAAYFLQWIINYFVRFCASLGFVLSGADNRESLSAPSSPPKTALMASEQDAPSPDRTPVKMNEPVDCSVSLSGSMASRMNINRPYRHTSVSSSTEDSRKMAGSSAGETSTSFDKNKVIVYGAGNKLKGQFSAPIGGPTEFVWLDKNDNNQISITGSFLRYALSFPLAFEDGFLRISLKVPPGDHDYEFIATSYTS